MENKKQIILASASPRRRDLLLGAGVDFTVVPSDYDENIRNKPFSYELIEYTAEQKGLSVQSKINEPAVIISADTAVVYNNIILGKPKDFNDAFRMLSLLSSHTHNVITSVCVIDNEKNQKIIKSETSEVTFNKISADDIKDYIYKFKPFDKAGSYGIQELSDNFINNIKGDYENIIGLPVNLLINMLNETADFSVKYN